MSETPHVTLPTLTGGQAASWAALLEIAPSLGEHWLLIGGQMVFLHEIERQASNVRPTDDVDVAIDLRTEPLGLAAIHTALNAAGFTQDVPASDGTAHRYRRNRAAIDVLAPDHIGPRAKLRIGAGRTVEAPGTTQGFRRSRVVSVELEGLTATIRSPDLVGPSWARPQQQRRSHRRLQPSNANIYRTSTR